MQRAREILIGLIILTLAAIIALIMWLASQEMMIAISMIIAFLLVLLTLEATIYLKMRRKGSGRA